MLLNMHKVDLKNYMGPGEGMEEEETKMNQISPHLSAYIGK